MITSARFILSIAVVSVLGLAACTSDHGSADQKTASMNNQLSTATGQHFQAQLALDGAPKISSDGQSIVVQVNVTNTGSGTFGSETTPNNVNIGAHSVDAMGKIIDQDLARGHLPQVTQGATATTSILLPLDKVLNKSAEILPVQENVAWFDKWGTKPLIVGPFNSCSGDNVGKVCDASGKPLATATAKQ